MFPNSIKKYLLLNLCAWVVLFLFTVPQYIKMAQSGCAFYPTWLACGDVQHSPKLLMVIAVFFFFSVFVFTGYKILNWYLDNIDQKVSKLTMVLSFFYLAFPFFTLPIGSGDIMYYFNAGRAYAGGINVYVQPWIMFNPFALSVYNGSAVTGVMYGPIMVELFKDFFKLSIGSAILFIFIWKFFMLTLFLLCGASLFYIISKINKTMERSTFLSFWLLQPLVLFEIIASGHFDLLWIIFLLGAIYFGEQKNWFWVIIFLIIGTWIKFLPLIFVPWFMLWWLQDMRNGHWQKKLFSTMAGLFIGAGITVLFWGPFWVGPVVFNPIIIQSKWAAQSVFAGIYYSLKPISNYMFASNSHYILTRFVHALLLITVCYFLYPYFIKVIRMVFKKETMADNDFFQAIIITMVVYLFVWQKSFWPWYATWVVVLAIPQYLRHKNYFLKKIILWLGTVPLLFYPIFYFNYIITGGDSSVELWFNYYLFFLIMAYPLFQLFRWRKLNYQMIINK